LREAGAAGRGRLVKVLARAKVSKALTVRAQVQWEAAEKIARGR
jgi:hypothetical protein